MKNLLLVLLVLSVFSFTLIHGKALRKSSIEAENTMETNAGTRIELGMKTEGGKTQWFHPTNQGCIDACKQSGNYLLTPSSEYWACGWFNTYLDYGYGTKFIYAYIPLDC